jgi:hypothetical protein
MSLERALNIIGLLSLHRLSGNGLQCRGFFRFHVQLLMSWLAVIYPQIRLRFTKVGAPPPFIPPSKDDHLLRHRPVSLRTVNCRLLDWINYKWKLYYSRRSVGQSIMVSSTHLGSKTRLSSLSGSCGLMVWVATSVQRMGLSYPIAFASVVALRSESCGTHYHILLF